MAIKQKGERRWKRAQLSERKYRQRLVDDSTTLLTRKLEEDRKYFLECYSVDIYTLLPNKICLELGGGPSISSLVKRLLRKVRCKIISIDPLIMPEKYGYSTYSPHRVCGIGEFLPFKDASFDIVLCLNVLDHVITPVEVLKEIKMVLAQGGSLFLWVHSYKIPKPVRQLLNHFDAPHPHHFSHLDLIQMFGREGYEVIFQRLIRPKVNILTLIKTSSLSSTIKYLIAIYLFNIHESSFYIKRR